MLALLRGGNSRADAARIDLSVPVATAQYVVMDTELTGLDYKLDSIVSVGAVKMIRKVACVPAWAG